MEGTTGLERPADRYGPQRTPRSQRTWLGILAVAVALGVVLSAVWARASRDEVNWRDVGYRVEGDTSTRVTFQVTMDPGQVAVCTVRALSESFAEVGLVDVTVGPSTGRTVAAVATVPTAERAVTGTVKDCALRTG